MDERQANNPPPPDETPGGQGEGPEIASRSDLRLVAMSARQRWPITGEMRAAIVKRVFDMVTNEKSNERTALSAVRALTDMDRINLGQEVKDGTIGLPAEGTPSAPTGPTADDLRGLVKEMKATIPPPQLPGPNGNGEAHGDGHLQ